MGKIKTFKIIFLLFFLSIKTLYSIEQRGIGPIGATPLFLPSSNLVNKGEIIFSATLFDIKKESSKEQSKNYIPYVKGTYGITNKWSITYTLPFLITKIYKKNPDATISYKGVLNSYPRMEFSIYEKKTKEKSFVASIEFGLEVPTASLNRKVVPNSSNDQIQEDFSSLSAGRRPAFGFTIGTFLEFISSWYSFASMGTILDVTYKNYRPGELFFLNFGTGPVMKLKEKLYLAILGEFTANFIQKSYLNKIVLPNTGRKNFRGSLTFYLAYKKMAIQFGVQFPIFEDLNGRQFFRFKYNIGASIGFLF